MVARQRFREAQDELDELRSLIQDQAAQLEDYRHKYMTVSINHKIYLPRNRKYRLIHNN